jgi:hypothetical protein
MMSASHFSIDSLSQTELSLMQQNSDMDDFADFEKHQLQLNDEDEFSSSDLSPSSHREYNDIQLSKKIHIDEFSSDDDSESDPNSFPIEPTKITLPAPFMFPSILMYFFSTKFH